MLNFSTFLTGTPFGCLRIRSNVIFGTSAIHVATAALLEKSESLKSISPYLEVDLSSSL